MPDPKNVDSQFMLKDGNQISIALPLATFSYFNWSE